jgi:hypothetical protein
LATSDDDDSILAYTPFAKKPKTKPESDFSEMGSDEITNTSYKSEDPGGTSKRGRSPEYAEKMEVARRKQAWRKQYYRPGLGPAPIVQLDMDPTEGAIAALTTGALDRNADHNATFENGEVTCLAGQVIMDDETSGKTRSQMWWEEYYPILQVKRIVWHSTLSTKNGRGVARMVFFVTDGLHEMPMVASTRKQSLIAHFWSRKGPYEKGILRQGTIFKLIDYQMGLKKDPESGVMVPCIFVEKVRPQPKRNQQKFRTIRALVREEIFE